MFDIDIEEWLKPDFQSYKVINIIVIMWLLFNSILSQLKMWVGASHLKMAPAIKIILGRNLRESYFMHLKIVKLCRHKDVSEKSWHFFAKKRHCTYTWHKIAEVIETTGQTWNLSKNLHDPIFGRKNVTHWKRVNRDYFR